MSDELQALCFMAGANSIFYGEKLLTTGNPDTQHDQELFRRLKIHAESPATSESAVRGRAAGRARRRLLLSRRRSFCGIVIAYER